ncbi:unnamed protein product [Mytilus coruscus]|uniref:SGNH hydrolase-type esterase domain-containing protein n=1 Tax=Mytilus coruscus TaxID=42192 RepID=A0A6J8B8B1_MYTCO|nr:unnamed protein product [Mytilus coruscus]
MSDLNQDLRTVYPRSSKKRIDYKVLNQRGIMQSDTVTTEPEVSTSLQWAAVGSEESELHMSKIGFEDLKDRLSIYMDSGDESDTDEETRELVKKLKEIKKKEKVMKTKKRKIELRQEIEKKMKELSELEELEMKGLLSRRRRRRKLARWRNSLSWQKIRAKIKREIALSGLPTYQGCRIPVFSKLKIEFFRSMLVDYNDQILYDLLELGFPIGYTAGDIVDIKKPRNHSGARDFPDFFMKYLKKELEYKAVIGPLKVNPFIYSSLVLSPLNSVPKSTPGERRVILDLSFPSENCINAGIDKDIYLDRKYSEIDMTFKWETISKEKLNTVLEESSTRDEILGYENTPFEINCSGVERAEQQLNNIFKTLTMRSCKIIKSFCKKKLKKKKPWEDRELADVKKTVSNLAKLLQINPYNLNLRNNFLGHCKLCKKLIKRKKIQFKKEIFSKLSALRDTDPKQYWKLLKSLKYENTNNKIELQAGFPEIIDHFMHQGETSTVMVLNSGCTRDAYMQYCLREILFYAAKYNFEIKAVLFTGVENRTADILSRWHSDPRFEDLFYELPVIRMEPRTFLIVSDSIAKYVKLENADVFVFRGAFIGDITYQLNKNKGSIYQGYNCLIIHVGTNDMHLLSINQFKSAYCNLISTAKSLFPSMVIALTGILPRPVDFEETGQKIKEINIAMFAL